MVCKNISTQIEYRYTFIENGNVRLVDKDSNEIIESYENWCTDYYITDKWRNTPR